MPPKKKEEKCDFSECVKCLVLVLPKDREKHESHCTEWSPGFDVDYDFIAEKTIYGTVRGIQNRDSDLEKLSMAFQQQVLFLNPSTMKVCDMKCGSYVHVSTESGCSSLKIAWPSSVLGLLAVSPLMPDRDLSTAMKIKVRRHSSRVPDAARVELQLVSGDTEDESLLIEAFRRKFFSSCLQEGTTVTLSHLCEILKLRVRNIVPEDRPLEDSLAQLSVTEEAGSYLRISHKTQMSLVKPSLAEADERLTEKQLSYDDIGGLRSQKETLQSLTRISDNKVRKLLTIGKFPPRRLLLTGPPGTGKTLLVKAVATDLKKEIFDLNAQNFTQLLGKDANETSRLASKAASCLVVVDGVDTFSGKKDKETQGKLLAFLKKLPEQTLVIATTNKSSNVDSTLLALFDREIETSIPSSNERCEILKLSLRDVPHAVTDDELIEISSSLHGYTGANIETLVRESLAPSMSETEDICVRAEHLKRALKVVRPLEMRDVVLEIPKVYWKDIGGMENVKKRFRQCVEWPILHKEAFQRFKIKPPSGLLMYGPPGCSKTMIARALATESSLNFLAVNGSELFSKWVGDSEKAVRDLFRRARNVAPAVVFFDEIDAIASKRENSSGGSGVGERVLTQLLTEIDGIEGLENVILIAATNRPDIIDEALLRPGRLDCVVYVPLPDDETRREILKISLSQRQVDEDVKIDDLVTKTKGYSGAEIVAVVQEAVMKALEESFEILAIGDRHFAQALDTVRPRISEESIKFYEQFHKTFNKR